MFSAIALLLVAQKPAPPSAGSAPERQILWQRTLDDALELSRSEGRPMLIAVNMDGESASERIVRENYRDPDFVAHTRPFVCLVASAFRHSPRDHDDDGRRIPCPRLGEVTCGEHIALEPLLFDRYLGGERIAPRHALIQLDGTKTFDLSLLFDLTEIDRTLREAAKGAPPPRPVLPAPTSVAPADSLERTSYFRQLARSRDHRERLILESFALAARAERSGEFLDALRVGGNAGSSELLRILFAKTAGVADPSAFAEEIAGVAEKIGAAEPCASSLREQIAGPGRFPGAPGLDREAALLPSLARLGGKQAPRTLLLSYAALGSSAANEDASECSQAWLALERLLGDKRARDMRASLDASGGAFDPAQFVAAARERAVALPVAPATNPIQPRTDDELVAELESLEPQLARTPDDAALQERSGRASLELAQLRLSNGAKGVEFLLEDARAALERASRARPQDAALLLERAHVAYLLANFEEQENLAQRALDLAAGQKLDGSEHKRVEAWRWLGDAAGRRLFERSQGEPELELTGMLRGARALAAAALSREATDTDWVSLASFFGALGRTREQIAIAQLALERLPESDAIRGELNRALELAGRPELAVAKAAWLADRRSNSASSVWYLGYALVVQAGWLRRGEDPDAAIAAYARAEAAFEKSRALQASFDESVRHYLALCALGRGFAHLLAERRPEAADALAQAISIRPAIVSVRDALDREALDLLDGALEWRASGPSPVDVQSLTERMERADPGNAFWSRSISDSELREALRAIGRGEPEVGVRYLRVALTAARRAVATNDDEENRRALAQVATVLAEHELPAEGDPAEVRALLAEAAVLLGRDPPSADADRASLGELAASLRALLGEARPVLRPGR